MLLGSETTPFRWFHTWRVTHTSTTAQVASTVLATALITMGNASQDPANVHRNATIAWISVTAITMTARTAAVRTGSGNGCRRAGSSTHNGRAISSCSPSVSSEVRAGPGMSRSGAPRTCRTTERPATLSSDALRRSAVPITVSLPTAGKPLAPASEDSDSPVTARLALFYAAGMRDAAPVSHSAPISHT